MSPAPRDRVQQAMPQGSPAKGGLGMTLRNDIKGDLRITDIASGVFSCVAVCCSVLQAVCCSVLPFVAGCCSVLLTSKGGEV